MRSNSNNFYGLLREKKNKMPLKQPAILLPTVTHLELGGRLPALQPGRKDRGESTGVQLLKTLQEHPHPVRESGLS